MACTGGRSDAEAMSKAAVVLLASTANLSRYSLSPEPSRNLAVTVVLGKPDHAQGCLERPSGSSHQHNRPSRVGQGIRNKSEPGSASMGRNSLAIATDSSEQGWAVKGGLVAADANRAHPNSKRADGCNRSLRAPKSIKVSKRFRSAKGLGVWICVEFAIPLSEARSRTQIWALCPPG